MLIVLQNWPGISVSAAPFGWQLLNFVDPLSGRLFKELYRDWFDWIISWNWADLAGCTRLIWNLLDVLRRTGLWCFTRVSGHKFLFNLPGAAATVLVGTMLYYSPGDSGIIGGMGGEFGLPGLKGFGLNFPAPESGGLKEMFGKSL